MTIADALRKKNVTPESRIEIMYLSVSEISDDLSEAEMRARLEQALGGADKLQQVLQQLDEDSGLIRELASTWLEAAEDEPAWHPAVLGAVEDSGRSAAALEIAAVTIIALYAMYLILPPVSAETEISEKLPDGTTRTYRKTTYHKFPDFSRTILSLLGRNSRQDTIEHKDSPEED